MKWPGKTASAFPSSEPSPALILLITGMKERELDTNPILSPKAFRVRALLSFLSEEPPEVLSWLTDHTG